MLRKHTKKTQQKTNTTKNTVPKKQKTKEPKKTQKSLRPDGHPSMGRAEWHASAKGLCGSGCAWGEKAVLRTVMAHVLE